MLRPLARGALAALLLTFTACSQSGEGTAPRITIPEPLPPDPAVAAKEAAYREHLDAGRKALDANDTDGAIAHFERAAGTKPKGSEAHLHLARLYASKKDDEKAIKSYDVALNLNPRLGDASLERAALLERAGRLEDAHGEYGRLIGQELGDKLTAKGYWLRAELADRLGNRADFRYDREQAMSLDPDYKARVKGGDVLVVNATEKVFTVTIDKLLTPEGTERTLPPGTKFTVPDTTSTYLTEKGRYIQARWVRVTITVEDRSKSYTATYDKGMSLEVCIFPEHLPR